MTKNRCFSSTAILLLTIGISRAADPPDVKEGLWSIHKQMLDNPGNKKSESTSTICRNHAYDLHVQSLAKAMKGCTIVNKGENGKYSAELHCVVAGTNVESKETATYQGNTATHSETHATYTPPLAGISEMTIITDQKYIGGCPAGVQPGDLISSDGTVNHLWEH
jgi:hypothetical protein